MSCVSRLTASAVHDVMHEVERDVEVVARPFPLREQVDGRLVPLALERFLRRLQDRLQFGIGARGDPQFEERDVHRVLDVLEVRLERPAHARLVARQLVDRLAERLQALRVQVLDRGTHDVDLGREVMQHRAARQPGLLGDDGRRRARVAEVDHAAQRGLDDLQPRRGAFLRLPAGRSWRGRRRRRRARGASCRRASSADSGQRMWGLSGKVKDD